MCIRDSAPSVQSCDWCISYPANEQLKFFMLANYLMYKNGEFPEYERYNAEMEAALPETLVEIEKSVDDWAAEYAHAKYLQHKANPDLPHYFIGAGTQWGATYSYACLLYTSRRPFSWDFDWTIYRYRKNFHKYYDDSTKISCIGGK